MTVVRISTICLENALEGLRSRTAKLARTAAVRRASAEIESP
jgi:hypothetical protein